MEILNYGQLLSTAENVTLQAICEGKLKLVSRGWTKVNIDPVLLEQIAKDVTNILGGRHNTKKVIIDQLTRPERRSLYHPYMNSVHLRKGEDNTPVWKFSPRSNHKDAKQDLRNYFNRL